MKRHVFVGCVLALSACAASKTVPPAITATTTAADLAALGQQYLSIVTPADAALTAFELKLNSQTAGWQIAVEAYPARVAMRTMDTNLVQDVWPPKVAQDVRAVVTANTAVEVDLDSGAYVTDVNSSGWFQQFQADSNKLARSAAVVRAELNLAVVP